MGRPKGSKNVATHQIVYAIINHAPPGSMVYIGRTSVKGSEDDLPRRLSEHERDLRANMHGNAKMQADFNAGLWNAEMLNLGVFVKDIARLKEDEEMNKIPLGHCYNMKQRRSEPHTWYSDADKASAIARVQALIATGMSSRRARMQAERETGVGAGTLDHLLAGRPVLQKGASLNELKTKHRIL